MPRSPRLTKAATLIISPWPTSWPRNFISSVGGPELPVPTSRKQCNTITNGVLPLRWQVYVGITLWLPLAGTLTGTSTPKSGVTTASSALEILDMESFGKAYRTICSEIDLDRLIKRLMAIVMENAGAEYGALILEQDGKLVIAGHSRFGAQSIVMTSPVEITAGVAVAETVVRHAYRTRKLVVLADAAHDRLFAADPYIQSRRPRSILAIPLLKQENCLGVIYLENNLANDFFQPERGRNLATTDGPGGGFSRKCSII